MHTLVSHLDLFQYAAKNLKTNFNSLKVSHNLFKCKFDTLK